jgi:hypothetical protein
MRALARINTRLGKVVRNRFLVFSSLLAASALLTAAPASAETSTESSSGSGWTVQEEGEASGGEVNQGSSIGSGTSSPPPAPVVEEPAPPPAEESHQEPSYSGEESYEGEAGGEYESEASTYVEPTEATTAPESKPAKKPPAVSGSAAIVRPAPKPATVDVSASPAPDGTASSDGTSVVSGAKVLLWLLAVAVGVAIVAQPRLWGRRSPPSRGSSNGRPPGPIGPTALEGSRHRSPSSPRPRRSSQEHP